MTEQERIEIAAQRLVVAYGDDAALRARSRAAYARSEAAARRDGGLPASFWRKVADYLDAAPERGIGASTDPQDLRVGAPLRRRDVDVDASHAVFGEPHVEQP